jgi:hypothetical protein
LERIDRNDVQSQKGRMVPKSADDKNQSKLFLEKARELGCDEDPAHFDEILKKVARHKPPPADDKAAADARLKKEAGWKSWARISMVRAISRIKRVAIRPNPSQRIACCMRVIPSGFGFP